jgi:hypothetical protein
VRGGDTGSGIGVTAAGNETFEAWRDHDHDDLVLAVALPLYAGSFQRTRVYV